VKLARALGTPHGRKKHGLVLLEGVRAAEAALQTGSRVKAALLTPETLTAPQNESLVRRLETAHVPAYQLPDALYRTVSQVEAPQGIALLCTPPRLTLAEALRSEFVLVADRLQDPGNLGTLLRLAQAFGVDAVITTRSTVEVSNPKAVRAAAGVWPGLAVAEGAAPERLSAELTERGFRVLVSDPLGPHDFRKPFWSDRVALVLGSEAHGVGRELRGIAAAGVRVPLSDKVESLNVAAAAAILLAEAARQRGGL